MSGTSPRVSRGRIVFPGVFATWGPGIGHARVFGYGLGWKDSRRHRPLWSERERIYRQFQVGPWVLTPLPPGDRGIRR